MDGVARTLLLDTGPLVAFLDRRDVYHRWAHERFANTYSPLLTCESVISEACFLTRGIPSGNESVLRLWEQGIVLVPFSMQQELTTVLALVQRYRNVPLSCADASLVRMSELVDDCAVLAPDP